MTKSILIVDNSQVFRRATRDFIECHTPFGVCGEAIDGLDAVDKARKLRPDLIILDAAMPRLNGLQAARAIRRISSVPIILFTLQAEAVRAQDVLAVGIDAVVPKGGNLSLLGRQVMERGERAACAKNYVKGALASIKKEMALPRVSASAIKAIARREKSPIPDYPGQAGIRRGRSYLLSLAYTPESRAN